MSLGSKPQFYNSIEGSLQDSDTIGTQLVQIPSDVHTRVILVEDLSPFLIELLGVTFQLNPEFFKCHLQGSKYNVRTKQEPASSTWKTRELTRRYTSSPGEGLEPVPNFPNT